MPAIRAFRSADQEEVRALILAGLGQRFGHVDETVNPDLNDIQTHYVEQGASVLVVEDGEDIIGCGALIREYGSDEVARIVRVSVRANRQGEGIGRAISERLVEIAGARGFKRVLVETNDGWYSALRLYQSCGFVEYQRTRDKRFGFIEVHMQLAL